MHWSQLQPVALWQALPSGSTQLSGEQQSAPVVHAWYWLPQLAGTAQEPSMHASVGALQQSASATQLPPDGAQVLVDLQVPLVAPAGMSHARPAQQSLS